MIKRIELEKKHRYLIQSLLATAFIYVVSQNIFSLSLVGMALSSIFVVVIGTFIIHFPNVSLKNLPLITLMPISILSGSIIFLRFFPNLGIPFKIVSILSFGILYYLVSLMDNIFLVIEDRGEVIPLYRVASVWGQIIQIIVAIPLFAGIFKFNTSAFTQAFLISIVSFLYCLYQIWYLKFDVDAKKTKIGETYYLSMLTAFLVFVVTLAVSFIPTESFLRALFSASGLMFGITYVTSYLKNELSVKLLFQYILICLIFFLFLISFTP